MKATEARWVKIAVCAATVIASVSGLNAAQIADAWALAESTTGAGSLTVNANESGQAVTVNFEAAGSPPSPVVCDLLIGGSDPGNVFTGDLLGAGYSGVQFKINGTGSQPDYLALIIHQLYREGTPDEFSRIWKFPVNAELSASGEWIYTLAPLDLNKGWETAAKEGRYTHEELWAMDLADVHSMYLRIIPSEGRAGAVAYSVADFRLAGSGVISEPAVLTPLEAYFGVSSVAQMNAAMMAQDSDGDGMSDYNELLAGLDPMDANSVLNTKVAVAPEGNTVSWQGVLGATYGVMRSNNLKAGFELIASDKKPSFTGQAMSFTDESPAADAPNYYRVVKY